DPHHRRTAHRAARQFAGLRLQGAVGAADSRVRRSRNSCRDLCASHGQSNGGSASNGKRQAGGLRRVPAGRGQARRRLPGALTMNRYAIIDASAFEDTAKALHYYTQDLRHRSLFERQPEAALADLGPWLLQLPDHPHTQVDGWLRALALEKPVVAWLESRADFDAVFDHLEQCLDLRRPDGKIAL